MSTQRTPSMDSRRYSQVISHHSSSVIWERANRCACWNLDTEQPNISCLACDGTGYVYLPGVTEHDGIFCAGLVLTKEFNGMGDWKMGDLIGTIPYEVVRQPSPQSRSFARNPLFPVGEWDKFTLMDALFRTHETLVRGQARPGILAETLRYSRIPINADTNKPFVDYILTANPATGAVTYYAVGTDYTITGNTINWMTGRGPADGQQYAVTYWHNPVYIVYTQLPQSRDGLEGQHMPRKIVLRYRDDL